MERLPLNPAALSGQAKGSLVVASDVLTRSRNRERLRHVQPTGTLSNVPKTSLVPQERGGVMLESGAVNIAVQRRNLLLFASVDAGPSHTDPAAHGDAASTASVVAELTRGESELEEVSISALARGFGSPLSPSCRPTIRGSY